MGDRPDRALRSAAEMDTYRSTARAWLKERLRPRTSRRQRAVGGGARRVAVFHDLTFAEERALLDRLMAWQRERFDGGYGAITWPEEYGGAGLSVDHERAYRREEAGFEIPEIHETYSVTVGLIAPTVRLVGTEDQRRRFVRRLLRADELCCQLFSEPGAGSDLAGLATRAERDGEEWIINGQKVWSSGAQFSEWGELIARTDPNVPKHAGMTAFMVPMDSPGVEVRPTRQMSGGSSFNEVFLSDVRIPDSLAPRRRRRRLEGGPHDARLRAGQRGRRRRRRRDLVRPCWPWPGTWTRRRIPSSANGSPACTPTSGSASSTRRPVLGGGRQRRAARSRRVGLQADVGPGDDPDGRSGGGPARAPDHRRHR